VKSVNLESLTWPTAHLGDAIDVLCRKVAIGESAREIPNPRENCDESAIGDWIAWYMKKRGCEAEALITTFCELEAELATAYPAILRLCRGRFLVIVSFRRGRLEVITPSGRVQKVEVRQVARYLAEPLVATQRQELESLLGGGSIPDARRRAALDLLLTESLRGRRFDELWLLRVPPGASAGLWLRQANAFRTGAAILAAHTSQYLLWIVSWALIGQLSLNGQLDRGWLLAWALLLFTLVPLRLLTTWKQGLLAVGVGGMLKARLLQGALRLHPDELRSQGVGHFLTQAFEAETVESLALSGGVEGILAGIEIVLAACILGWVACALLACFVGTLAIVYWFEARYHKWTRTRFEMTHDLVEVMVGHRTRLVQQPKSEWHEAEDQALDHYMQVSGKLDRTGTILMAAVPRAWLVAGILCLFPAVVGGSEPVATMAAKLGGILLAYTALKRMAASFTEIAAVSSAWKSVFPLFTSASRPENNGSHPMAAREPAEGLHGLIEADGLSFRYRPESPAVLKACTICIHSGDRILLEGQSGGGKSTFAALLTGAREPDSGLLLMNGLDKQTLGDEQWRRRLVSAPQFHENHILTETLAFNLLMGRRWPPLARDMDEAESLCRELGLGTLLDTMPAGLLQMVGEGGWQLSHGERSRVFMARALLQDADLVVLDESFAALDPENLKTALDCALEKAKTLLVIAHP
jgi:ATP-binding cassette subfamily B protein